VRQSNNTEYTFTGMLGNNRRAETGSNIVKIGEQDK